MLTRTLLNGEVWETPSTDVEADLPAPLAGDRRSQLEAAIKAVDYAAVWETLKVLLGSGTGLGSPQCQPFCLCASLGMFASDVSQFIKDAFLDYREAASCGASRLDCFRETQRHRTPSVQTVSDCWLTESCWQGDGVSATDLWFGPWCSFWIQPSALPSLTPLGHTRGRNCDITKLFLIYCLSTYLWAKLCLPLLQEHLLCVSTASSFVFCSPFDDLWQVTSAASN